MFLTFYFFNNLIHGFYIWGKSGIWCVCVCVCVFIRSVMPTLHSVSPTALETQGPMGARALPPSLSLLSPQAVSMDVSQPAPLQPSWQTQCHPFRSKVHLPLPLHRPGQPSARQSSQNQGLINHRHRLCSHTLTLNLSTHKRPSHSPAH